jgi:hypothetical protein
MAEFNLVLRCRADRPFLVDLGGSLFTRLGRKRAEAAMAANPGRFGCADGFMYRFSPAEENDFCWYERVGGGKLTGRAVYPGASLVRVGGVLEEA